MLLVDTIDACRIFSSAATRSCWASSKSVSRKLLPAQTRAALVGLHGKLDDLGFDRIVVTVDLFVPTTGPKRGLQALSLKDQGFGPTAIGKALGIKKRQADLAVQYGKHSERRGERTRSSS